eukprot:CAMPEP_0182886476 /NCGR_PEP_ID=MMETSP0034_2-20130328/20240_1 /TAXON_ID=156128 /ORGANISM="Nephroselmis pyriformis, Strain CCMP717" /LENGTH=64 /DNA_ID=CAMNT_0025019801 /DNA_START=113 /DNA_END=304 /DNA_ORIENTATION=-
MRLDGGEGTVDPRPEGRSSPHSPTPPLGHGGTSNSPTAEDLDSSAPPYPSPPARRGPRTWPART